MADRSSRPASSSHPPTDRRRRRPNALIGPLAQQAVRLEAEEARAAGALGFMARFHVQATLPHREPVGSSFDRRNGGLRLSIYAHPDVGLPYGRYPRLLLLWVTTEAVRTRSPVLHLGTSLRSFMGQLGLIPAGGPWGTIGRLRDQMKRLFSATISISYDAPQEGRWQEKGFRLADRTVLWWDPGKPTQLALWHSSVQLSRPFFDAIATRPVPVDLRAIRALRSPMALDIYTWLTYRNSYLRRKIEIPWEALRLQFGAGYSRPRAFKAAFLRHARTVLTVYPGARLEQAPGGLILKPSPPHVDKLPRG